MQSELERHSTLASASANVHTPALQTARKLDAGCWASHATGAQFGFAQSAARQRACNRFSSLSLIAVAPGLQPHCGQQPAKVVITHSLSVWQTGGGEGTSPKATPESTVTAKTRRCNDYPPGLMPETIVVRSSPPV